MSEIIDHNFLALSLSSHVCPCCGEPKKMGERWCWSCRGKIGAGWSNRIHFATWKKRAGIINKILSQFGNGNVYCPDGSSFSLEKSEEK